jgi:hypothetical protein
MPEINCREGIFISVVYTFYKWLKNTLSYKTVNYASYLESIYNDLAVNKIKTDIKGNDNDKKIIDPEDRWKCFYKEATKLLNNSNIHNFYYRFLSKYNSFRSITFVFAFSILYNIIISSLFNTESGIYSLIIFINVICLSSFHEKYKRYWELCGNEVITGLDIYYKLDENKH